VITSQNKRRNLTSSIPVSYSVIFAHVKPTVFQHLNLEINSAFMKLDSSMPAVNLDQWEFCLYKDFTVSCLINF